MPRARSPNRNKAFLLWKSSKGKRKNKDIAAELGVSEKLISRWKKEDKWEEKSTFKKAKKSTKRKSRKSNTKREKSPEEKKCNNAIAKELNENDDLSENDQMFLMYWMRDRNATQAYFRTHKCKYETAMVEGCRKLKNPKIIKEIQKLKKIRNDTLFLEPEDLIERQMKIAFADITDFAVIRHGRMYLVNSDMLDGGVIAEIKNTKYGAEIKLENRDKALRWLGEYFMMNPMSRHKKEYDNALLKLKEKEIEIKDW